MRKPIMPLKIICLCLLSLILNNKSFAAEQLDSIAAIVNNNIITVSQLNQRVMTIKQQLQQQKIKLPPDAVLSKQVLQLMINQSLEQETAKRLNITATDADLKRAADSIAAHQKISITQLYQSLAQRGISKAEFTKEIKRQIITEKLLHNAVVTRINVTPQEIDAAMKGALQQSGRQNEFHLLNILIPLPDSPSPQQLSNAQRKAQQLIRQLKNGEDFKTLAAAQSGGAQVFKGGDLGWKTLTELPTIFASHIPNMKKNDVAGPIRTGNGFYIIKLIGVRGKTLNMNKKALHQQIVNMITQRKLAEAQQAWLAQLRATSYIKILYQPKMLPSPL